MYKKIISDEIRAYKKKIGINLAARRKEKGLSQANLAELVGISTSSLGCIEIGRSQPKIDTLWKFAKILGIQPHEIYINEPNKSEKELRETRNKLNEANIKLEEANKTIEKLKFCKKLVQELGKIYDKEIL